MENKTEAALIYNTTSLAEELPLYGAEYYIDPPENKPPVLYSMVKRVLDILFAVLGIVLLALPMAVIAGVVAAGSPGAPIFRQERLGRNGKPFIIYKFRTMRLDAENDGPKWAKENDERCTKIGTALRHCHLDELPQLWNILKGDMSFVGPRPERRYFYEEFEKYVHGFSNRLAVRPGLTGLAQVNGGYELPPEKKVVFDMKYINSVSLMMDIRCVLKTIKIIFARKES